MNQPSAHIIIVTSDCPRLPDLSVHGMSSSCDHTVSLWVLQTHLGFSRWWESLPALSPAPQEFSVCKKSSTVSYQLTKVLQVGGGLAEAPAEPLKSLLGVGMPTTLMAC